MHATRNIEWGSDFDRIERELVNIDTAYKGES